MPFVLPLWILLFAVFIGVPIGYYLYMKSQVKKPWNFKIEKNYEPNVTILVPMHNEEDSIRFKLQNLQKLHYPENKLNIVLINDASTDNTMDEIHSFLSTCKCSNLRIIDRPKRGGKSASLNYALHQINSEIIVISDADCFLSADALKKAMPYLSNDEIGAVAGKEVLLNPTGSWVTQGELIYNNFVRTLRLGESKYHSTVFFQGGFAAYKKAFLKEFDTENDDSGTAFNLVQENHRTIILPEVQFFTLFPTNWKNKMIMKLRRANQLQQLWFKCLNLTLHGKLVLPKRIALSEIFLHIFNPLLFLTLIFVTSLFILAQPPVLFVFFFLLLFVLLIPKTRISVIENIQNNFVLLFALFSFLTGKKFKQWKTVAESRSCLTEELLQAKNLL